MCPCDIYKKINAQLYKYGHIYIYIYIYIYISYFRKTILEINQKLISNEFGNLKQDAQNLILGTFDIK